MIYKYCYLAGSNLFCLESGISRIASYGVDLPHDNEVARANSEVVYRLFEKFKADHRPAGGPRARVAFVQGNLDSYSGGWGGGYAWSQFKQEWAYGAAEHTWKILKEVNKKRDWWEPDCYDKQGIDVSAGAPDGSYDVIPAVASAAAMQRYDVLIFAGWNTMTEALYEKLLTFVKNGGTLFITAAHLNTNPVRGGEPSYVRGGDMRDLLGCRFTGKRICSGLGHRFVAQSGVEGMYYPFPQLKPADPIYSCGNVNYAEAELDGGTVCATLADSFWPEEVPMPATVIENAVGKGRVICFTATDYAGNDAAYPIYRLIVRELLRAKSEDTLVQTCSEVRYARYGEDVVYLLNTSFDMPAIAVIDPLGRRESVTLAPMELRKIRVTKEQIETLCSM